MRLAPQPFTSMLYDLHLAHKGAHYFSSLGKLSRSQAPQQGIFTLFPDPSSTMPSHGLHYHPSHESSCWDGHLQPCMGHPQRLLKHSGSPHWASVQVDPTQTSNRPPPPRHRRIRVERSKGTAQGNQCTVWGRLFIPLHPPQRPYGGWKLQEHSQQATQRFSLWPGPPTLP